MSEFAVAELWSSAPVAGSLSSLFAYFLVTALGVKTLPLLVYACVPRRDRLGLSLFFSLVLGAVFALLFVFGELTSSKVTVVVAALLYYGAASAVAFRLAFAMRSKAIKKDAVFVLAALLFVL